MNPPRNIPVYTIVVIVVVILVFGSAVLPLGCTTAELKDAKSINDKTLAFFNTETGHVLIDATKPLGAIGVAVIMLASQLLGRVIKNRTALKPAKTRRKTDVPTP